MGKDIIIHGGMVMDTCANMLAAVKSIVYLPHSLLLAVKDAGELDSAVRATWVAATLRIWFLLPFHDHPALGRGAQYQLQCRLTLS